jgi:2-haloacid dehalogenase
MTVRALFFDVFGTVVDWRTGILDACRAVGRSLGRDGPWEAVADDWRRAYPPALLAARQEPEWRDLDRIQSDSLDAVLERHDLSLPARERQALVRAWRKLPPWPDSRDGLTELRRTLLTATLSNGHVALLVDLLRFGDLRVDAVLSAQLANSYKPDPAVYLRAVELLECAPEDAAMVAAHADDLEAAAAVGMRAVFVSRPQEWGPDSPPPRVPELPDLVIVERLGDVAPALR